MIIQNPDFTEAGLLPGEAAHWTIRSRVSGQRIAGFGPAPHRPWEDFERWYTLSLGFEDHDLALAFFDGHGDEDFGSGWGNDPYLVELPEGQVVPCPFSGNAIEAFEPGWSNEAFASSFDSLAAVIALFDFEPFEDFEENWLQNEDFIRDWSEVPSARAFFDGDEQDREDFENYWDTALTL